MISDINTMQETLADGKASALQKNVDVYFQSTMRYWDDIYRKRDLVSTIYQDRQAVALRLVDDLSLPRHSSILEVGCGTGVLTLALAHRGFHLFAVERFNAMVNLVKEKARQWKLQDGIAAMVGDVHRLPFSDGMFDVVIALGVLPWLHSPSRALAEMTRVTKAGGFLILSVDNRWRLSHILDPRFSPVAGTARTMVKHVLVSVGLRRPLVESPLPAMHSIKEFDFLLRTFGLKKIFATTIGFGPFTLMGRRILPDVFGNRLNRMFQQCSERRFLPFRSCGNHYVVLAERTSPACSPPVEEEAANRVSHSSSKR